ncbi:alkylation response protein AidB-like acyl-CoA dehydrogenase [Crossiella equi]|uniref:Medium-chain specific acyl-CoA dehydrogenase, mitochondrial n=1 Tax=Crossiella equi TaxID=130796 RepID=A0ABS5A4H9_9PSEU|nr:acyl-CoA dehydrogenase family protein [Crossiella equi]MBP2471448.1 alkylation response protein AidB-like acyl-CoA dehydrogenase [Crossiella equi]
MTASLAARYTAEHRPVVDSFRSFVDRELVPLATQVCGDDPAKITPELRAQVRARSAELGFYAPDYPEEVGGQDMPFSAKLLLHEAAEASGCPLAPVALSNAEGPSPLLLAGTPAQRERYLRPLVEGRMSRCLAMTELDGGSDAFSLTTKAERDGEGWRISGAKAFVSSADTADLVLVFASTETGDGRWVPGLFALPADAPGLEVGQRFDGLEGEPVFEVLLDGVAVGEEELIGGRAGLVGATAAGMTALARGRLLVAAVCNGIAARALDLGLAFAADRVSRGVRIATHQHVQEHFVSARLALESARLITTTAALAFDEGQDVFEDSALAKLAASEGALATVNRMFQVHGGAAWVRGHPMEHLYRRIRVMTIVEGTSEVQKTIIAHAMGLG